MLAQVIENWMTGRSRSTRSFTTPAASFREYEHGISILQSKSMHYRKGLFVDLTSEYGVRTGDFCISLYTSIIIKQDVRGPLSSPEMCVERMPLIAYN